MEENTRRRGGGTLTLVLLALALAAAPASAALGAVDRAPAGSVTAAAVVGTSTLLVGVARAEPSPVLYRLEGGSGNWQPRRLGPVATVLAIGAGPGGTAYAATLDRTSRGTVAVLRRSEDGGRTWTRASWRGAPAGAARAVSALAVDARHPWVVLAIAAGRVLRSTDAGRSWTAAGSGLPVRGAGGPQALVADPHRAGAFFVVTRGHGVFRTLNAGERWLASSTGLPRAGRLSLGALSVDPVFADSLYVAGSAGLFRSRDGGASWVAALADGSFRAPLALGWDVFVAGGAGLVASRDGGVVWQSLLTPGGLRPQRLIAVAQQGLLAITSLSDPNEGALCVRIHRSVDGGRSWREADAGLPLARRKCWLYTSRVA